MTTEPPRLRRSPGTLVRCLATIAMIAAALAVPRAVAPAAAATTPFDDVPAGAFYTSAVAWLADAEITTGTSPTTFSPNDLVNRAQMITFIWRLVNAKDAWGTGVTLPETVMF